MGGVAQPIQSAVKEVTKPIVKVAQETGLVSKPQAAPAPAPAPAAQGAAAPQPAEQAKPMSAVAAARSQTEEVLARRRARRGGRALLSEARLNAEQGIQSTLGAGPML